MPIPLTLRLMVVSTFVLIGCQGGGEETHDMDMGPAEITAAVPDSVPSQYTTGQALFQRSCVSCHGDWARGTEQGPPLVHIYYEPSHHADIAFLRAAQMGVRAHHWNFGDMPPVAGVTPEDIVAITAYIRWLQREAGIN